MLATKLNISHTIFNKDSMLIILALSLRGLYLTLVIQNDILHNKYQVVPLSLIKMLIKTPHTLR
ncbi:hypothetical protein XK97_13640 [Obesumbacterium proteus]|nr:hypothetical protein DSM2777_02410 [Obesumbacterium proteus]KKI45526.1 hypothetical protein XK97_13640 [Obesumbacterium proteus]